MATLGWSLSCERTAYVQKFRRVPWLNNSARQYLVAVDANSMQQVIAIAKAQQVSAETLINTWLEQQTRKAAYVY